MKIAPTSAEDHRQLEALNAPLRRKGSGLERYAAAMYFYNQGAIDAAALEAYRICAKDDAADPRSLSGVQA